MIVVFSVITMFTFEFGDLFEDFFDKKRLWTLIKRQKLGPEPDWEEKKWGLDSDHPHRPEKELGNSYGRGGVYGEGEFTGEGRKTDKVCVG